MPPIYAPDAEPLALTVKVRVSRRELRDLDLIAQEFGMSRSWVVREALRIGVPAARGQLQWLREAGFRPSGQANQSPFRWPRRGPRSDGPREDRWVHRPDLEPEGQKAPALDDDEE